MIEHGAFKSVSLAQAHAHHRVWPCVDSRPTALIIADVGDTALRDLLHDMDIRCLGAARIANASDRLDAIVDVGLVVVRCATPSAALADLLARLDMLVRMKDIGLVVIADIDCIDLAHGAVTGHAAQLLSAPSDVDLAVAIQLGIGSREHRHLLHDIAREDEDGNPIRMLREEIGRLTRLLDALMRSDDGFLRNLPRESIAGAQTPSAAHRLPSGQCEETGETESLEAIQLREMLRIRRMRDQFLPGDLFADPAWDMLLDLMAARLGGERVSVSSLCIASAVPPTTALRWIRQLTERGILERQADPADGRRIFIALSDEAAESISLWFAAIRPSLGIALG